MADTQYWPLQPKQQSASDIRKVIANATKTTWKWFTIANNDELKEQKDKKKQKQVKVSTPSWTATRTNTNVETPKVETTTTKEAPQWPTPFPVIDKSQLTWDIFKNPQLQWIKNIPTFQEDNQAEHNVASINNNDESFMNTFWRATELKKPVDVDNALMDLFVDVRWKVKSWTLAQSDVVKMKELYPEFANMWDDVILSMIWDMASIASKNMPFNNENMAKFKSLYPELTAASWWFDKWSSENMYQAWWMREQMAQSSKTDLNRFWTAWALAEWVINPLWEVTTLADMWAQMIPQVDGSWNENRLKKALSKLTDEDINKYYEQYQNYVKNHWTLSNLYTLQLEWDTVVEQLWNWATGKWKKDVDAWFRDWLIDRVNNEVNWWAWEVTWAANDLKWVWWPNIAKMYANMPASTVKTITAITRAITNPVDTAAWLYHLFWTEEGRQALIARYGSWDWFAKALEQDPVWVASDWLAVVEWWAWLTKMAAWWLSKASLLAWLSTEALWAARTTENLLKLATRLENMAIKAGKVEKTAWLASNIWVDLPINKVINWLKTWWESWESLIQKAAKYTANKATTWVWTIAGKVVDTWKDIIKRPISSLADLLMGSATDSDKLFKAASPNINRLSNNVDYKNKRAKMDLAEQAIVDAWYLPKSISEWAKAHTETLNKKWNEFKQLVADKWDVMVDVRDILKEVKDYIKSEKDWATELQKQDLRKLEVEVAALERMWKVDMNFIEKRKEHYNSSWRDSDKLKVWDVYLKGIKMIGNAMRKQQDNILGKWPESTKKLRKEIAALMDTKNDVIKADLRNQKKKSDIAWGGLVESYWRLSWLWDVIWWVVWWVLGKWWEWFAQAWKWLGKMVLWKAMGRAKDVDYLTKKGFEGLASKKKAQNSAWLQSKFKDSKELWNLYVERDNLRKELKKDNISDSRKEAINKRLDDIEYAIAQKKARAWLWDKERVLSEENKKKVIDMVSKRAKDVWFTTEVLDWMEKDTQGYTDLRKKLIALEKNPWDTTAQHELFHAFFSVVDNKTKTYILDEAKKILKESWMKDVNAEEWLAESFGIYAKRKQIKLWLIDAPKGFVTKVRDFFQKVYEFMQRFNGDRDTINKLFDEVLWDRQMKNWIIDLSDLLGDKEVKVRELWDNWLRNKAVYHGSPADFDKFDSSHMGEWEGAQAHGWGHYVAVEKGTAEWYANWGKNEIKIKWKSLKDERARLSNPTTDYNRVKGNLLYDIEYELSHWHKTKEDIERAINKLKLENKNTLKSFQEELEDPTKSQALRNLWYSEKEIKENTLRRIAEEKIKQKILNKITPDDVVVNNAKRNLYNIEIPDPKKAKTPTNSNYLEEGYTLNEKEANKMADAIDKYAEKNKNNFEFQDPIGKWRFERWEIDKNTLNNYTYENLKSEANSLRLAWMVKSDILLRNLQNSLWEKWASKFLESLGYDGIHYYWWRDWEAYVIFNDDALKIKDHIRYKKKIWDKEVEITPKVKSPNELIEKNADWLSVMKSFISEKQAEKALDVSKDILDENGNAYLWTHTNKYKDTPFANFENAKDSKYKDYKDKEIAFFTNSEEMSRSYAEWESKLADTKAPKTEDEFNKFIKSQELVNKGEWYEQKQYFKVEKNSKWDYVVTENDISKVKDKNLISFASVELWEAGKVLEKMNPEDIVKRIEERVKNNWDYIKISNLKEKNWSYYIDYESETKLSTIWTYKDKEELYAKVYSKLQSKDKYRYQWIIQNMKNPLLIDKEWAFGEKLNWNELWEVRDMIDEKVHKSIVSKTYKDNFYTAKVDVLRQELSHIDYNQTDSERNSFIIQLLRYTADNDVYAIKELVKDAPFNVDDVFERVNWELDWLQTFRELAQNSIDLLEQYKNELKNASFKSYADMLREEWWEFLVDYFKDKLWIIDENAPLLDMTTFRDSFYKRLTTNDWVKYALSQWEYDWVIFKNITDYGSNNYNKDLIKWWDVLVAFNSKQFKAWDNANPTDSKYISYKKKVSLDKKSEWLSKKDSNWLLAKGRDRMWDNGMRYKKSEYEQAVESWDNEKALWMIRKLAAEKGYNSSSDYQWSKAFNGSAPSSEWLTKAERLESDEVYSQTLWDYASDGLDLGNLDWELNDWLRMHQARWDVYEVESIKNLKKAVDEYKAWNKNAKIKMYRAIDADIKENWFRNGDWITPSKKYAEMHIWLQDWKKWRIIEEEVPIENIWWDNNDINEWWYDDGKEYWYKNTPNNKKELWITYDDEGKLIPLEKRFDEKNPDVRFKKKSEVPEDKKLIWLHNLSVDKLRKTVELWGMPMPSIAVTKKWIPHTDYWDVTFIMKESAINPKLNRNNKLYTVDGYTPMAQQPIVKMKDTKDAWAIEDKIEKETWLSYSEIEQWIENKEQMEYYHPELKKFDKEYNQMTEKKLWGWFTPSGKRRYLDYNLDNVVKKMKENKEDAFNWMYWKMVAQYEWETKTVDSLRERNYGLKNKEVWEELFNRYYSEVWDLYAKLWWWDSFREMWYFQDTLSYEYDRNTDRWLEKVKKDQPKDSVYTKLQKSDLEKLQKTIKEGAELQRPYSEAKPERWIRFDEVWAVVAPEGKLKEVKDMLKDTWLKVYWYKEGERMSVVDKVADDNGLRFKKKVDQTQTPEFKKWFEGSKVVDYKGEPLKVYHWTADKFTIFDHNKDWKNTGNKWLYGNWFYFTDNLQTAKEYGKMWVDLPFSDYGNIADWEKARFDKANIMEVYLDMKNPFYFKNIKNANQVRKLKEASGVRWLQWNDYLKEMRTLTDKQSVELAEYLQNAWYDGIIYEWDNWTEYAVFNPNQIKSATDNVWTFDKNNPDIRYKKWLEKKESWLEKKRTSTASSFQWRVDAIANELWVKWWNTVQKMKRINKIIKEDKYKWTDVKKRFYQLKWEYKKQYIINNDKKIKDKWFKKTTIRVWQNWKKADWHFTKKQYDELKELWYIVE